MHGIRGLPVSVQAQTAQKTASKLRLHKGLICFQRPTPFQTRRRSPADFGIVHATLKLDTTKRLGLSYQADLGHGPSMAWLERLMIQITEPSAPLIQTENLSIQRTSSARASQNSSLDYFPVHSKV